MTELAGAVARAEPVTGTSPGPFPEPSSRPVPGRWRAALAGRGWILALACGVLLAVAPWWASDYWVRQITLISIYSMVIVGLNLTFGYAGELALGQVAMFALGAYVAGITSIRGWDLLAELVLAGVAAGVLGAIVAVGGARLSGWGLAMSSFFLVILIPDIVDLFPSWTGGPYGLTGVPRATLLGSRLDDDAFHLVVGVVLILVVGAMRNLVLSPHGVALRVMRESEVLASSLGINPYRMRVTALALGAVPAGIAGALFVHLDRFVAPESFTFALAISFVAAAVLGGANSIYGAVVGAAILQLGPMRSTSFGRYSTVAYGVFLVLSAVFLAGGLAGLARRSARRAGLVGDQGAVAGAVAAGAGAAELRLALPADREGLTVRDVGKRFGGAVALDGVSLDARPGHVTGLVGSNGSGKTTLLNIVAGFYQPSAGTVSCDGLPLTGLPAYAVARRGVARTFQTPFAPSELTCLEVVMAARYVDDHVSVGSAIVRGPGLRRHRREVRAVAMAALSRVGMAHLAGVGASSLPLGSRRLLEIARALAAEPSVMLLDEPASGLDDAEVDSLAVLLRSMAGDGVTLILVDHNVQMVSEVADTMVVLDNGSVVATGDPRAVRRDPAVVSIYLGAGHAGNDTGEAEA